MEDFEATDITQSFLSIVDDCEIGDFQENECHFLDVMPSSFLGGYFEVISCVLRRRQRLARKP